MSVPAASSIRPKPPARPQLTSTVLVLEALLVLFAALAADGLDVAPADVVWPIAGALAVVLLGLSRLVTAPGGYIGGSIAQVLVIACGIAVPLMYLLGILFAALWVAAYRIGGRIDSERAAYDAAHRDDPSA